MLLLLIMVMMLMMMIMMIMMQESDEGARLRYARTAREHTEGGGGGRERRWRHTGTQLVNRGRCAFRCRSLSAAHLTIYGQCIQLTLFLACAWSPLFDSCASHRSPSRPWLLAPGPVVVVMVVAAPLLGVEITSIIVLDRPIN
jgi:hypothetical protein